MKPIEILMQEHRVIEIALGCLEAMVEKAGEEKRLEREPAEQIIDLIRNFADRCHHGKEEDRLFPAMVAKGVPSEGGPIGVMLMEHDMGREFVAQMANNIDKAANGDATSLQEFSEAAYGYINLLRSHIQKEDRILFPMADRIFDEDDQKKLLAEFAHVESDHMGSGTHERYLKLAETLAAKYGVTATAIAQAATGGCCHHH
jgi:hemerythrin-like domain-containing protein